jgi:hypothetical protein
MLQSLFCGYPKVEIRLTQLLNQIHSAYTSRFPRWLIKHMGLKRCDLMQDFGICIALERWLIRQQDVEDYAYRP